MRLGRSKLASDGIQVRVKGGVATLTGKTSIVQHKGSATRLQIGRRAPGGESNRDLGSRSSGSSSEDGCESTWRGKPFRPQQLPVPVQSPNQRWPLLLPLQPPRAVRPRRRFDAHRSSTNAARPRLRS